MLENIKILCHSCIRIEKEYTIYFDPFKIDKNYNDADIIFITHDHYDHYSEEDIDKVIKEDTIIVMPETMREQSKYKNILFVEPNEQYKIDNIEIVTVPAYNINKNFHPKENNCVGYLINIDNITYYIAGDTDKTPENRNLFCDVAFVPIGGTYTMTYLEAADLVNEIKPKVVVPIHYGLIVGTKEDAIKFKELIAKDIKCQILIK